MAYNGIFITRESILFAVCRDERKASFALLQNNNGIFILASRIWSEYSISIVGITDGERKKEEEFWNIYILNKFSSIPWKVKNQHLPRFDRIL